MKSVTIEARFQDRRTGDWSARDVELTFDGRVVRMEGGPTGHESFAMESAPRDRMEELGWLACFGTYRLYDRCEVDGHQMARAFEALVGARA